MKRFAIYTLLLLALCGANGPLTLKVDVKRTSLDLLDPVSVSIAINNSAKGLITAHFPNSDTYDLRLTNSKGTEVWDLIATHKAVPVKRTLGFTPGRTVLAVQLFDSQLPDRRSLAAGTYQLRVSLLDDKYAPSITLPVHFAEPTPISALQRLPLNSAVTVAGALKPNGTLMDITDETGSIKLTKRIGGGFPTGTFIVRGYINKENGELVFTVDHFARAIDNPAPAATPFIETPKPH